MIFAEGGTTNGTGLIKFKKGAFFAEKTIRPMFMKYSSGTVHPAFDTMEFLPLAILHMSWACYTCEVNVLPDFQPNEYLFETFKDKGTERWEIYAWALRDVMMKTGGFEACEKSLREKMEYEAFMQLKPDAKDPIASKVLEDKSLLSQIGISTYNSPLNDNDNG